MYCCGSTWRISRSIGIATALALLDHARDVALADLLVLDRDDAVRVEPLDVRARDAGVDRRDLAAGHVLGLVDRLLDRLHGRVDVDHDALAQALRGAVPMPMMSTPSSVTSPTMQAILVVPMSRPTMISSRLAMILAQSLLPLCADICADASFTVTRSGRARLST